MERNRHVVAAITKVLESLEVQKQLCLVPDGGWTESGNFGYEFFFRDEQSAYISYFGRFGEDEEFIQIEVSENHQDDPWIQMISEDIQKTIKHHSIRSIHNIQCSVFKKEGDNCRSAGRGLYLLWQREFL